MNSHILQEIRFWQKWLRGYRLRTHFGQMCLTNGFWLSVMTLYVTQEPTLHSRKSHLEVRGWSIMKQKWKTVVDSCQPVTWLNYVAQSERRRIQFWRFLKTVWSVSHKNHILNAAFTRSMGCSQYWNTEQCSIECNETLNIAFNVHTGFVLNFLTFSSLYGSSVH